MHIFHRWEVTDDETQTCRTCQRTRIRPRCGATSGSFVGYGCDLRDGHPLPHESVTSRTVDAFGRELGRTTVRWPATTEEER